MKPSLMLLSLLSGLSLMPCQSVLAETYAIVIGIDHYQNFGSLEGAVNDAKVVADALKASGVKNIKLLFNEQASRSAIVKAWQETASQAKSGDTVFITYAGHGSQIPERIKGSEADGMDEFYVLGGFDTAGKGTQERIRDDDLHEWFSQRADLNIILVSDSCHSGTMTRGYKTKKLKYRRVDIKAITDDALTASKVTDALDSLPHVVSIAGVPDSEEVPEVTIDKQSHGALSWFFAKGLLGEADANADGSISVSEFKNYLLAKVQMQTDGQQHPQVMSKNEVPLFRPIQQTTSDANLPKPLNDSLLPISLSIKSSSNPQAFAEKLSGVELVQSAQSLLEWDVDQQVISNQFNDLIINLKPNQETTKAYTRKDSNTPAISPETLAEVQAVINKFRAVEQIKLASDGSLAIKLWPDDKLHKKGDALEFEISRQKYNNLTLVNFTVDGKVNFLYPVLQNDSISIPVDKPYRLSGITVEAPYGADHIIAILSETPLNTLHDTLKNNDKTNVEQFLKLLKIALQKTRYQMAIHASFTTDSIN